MAPNGIGDIFTFRVAAREIAFIGPKDGAGFMARELLIEYL